MKSLMVYRAAVVPLFNDVKEVPRPEIPGLGIRWRFRNPFLNIVLSATYDTILLIGSISGRI